MAVLIESLPSLGSTFDGGLAIGILVSSIGVSELFPTVAFIITLSDLDIKWEKISSLLIKVS